MFILDVVSNVDCDAAGLVNLHLWSCMNPEREFAEIAKTFPLSFYISSTFPVCKIYSHDKENYLAFSATLE